MSKTPEASVVEDVVPPTQAPVNTNQGNLLSFDLSEFFGSEYLSFLDSFDPLLSLSLSPQWPSQPAMNLETHQF